MKNILFLFAFAFSIRSYADTKLILGNQVFELKEQQKAVCGENKGAPEYVAAILLMGVAQDFFPDRTPKEKMESVFKFIRAYPSRFTSKGCEALRDECESRCEKVQNFSKDDCKIECNQYENWNR